MAFCNINPGVASEQHPCHSITWPGTVEYLITSGQTQRASPCPSVLTDLWPRTNIRGWLCPQNLFALEEVISKALMILPRFTLRCGRIDTGPFTPPAIKESLRKNWLALIIPLNSTSVFKATLPHTLVYISSDQKQMGSNPVNYPASKMGGPSPGEKCGEIPFGDWSCPAPSERHPFMMFLVSLQTPLTF